MIIEIPIATELFYFLLGVAASAGAIFGLKSFLQREVKRTVVNLR